jgi:energy-coupling factor transporter ATP-binding protein EcfA2
MPRASLQPLPPPALPFSEFLSALMGALDQEGLRFCVLRNYQGFPTENDGGDIDFLILPSDLPRAISALRSVQGIRVVGYAERTYVASVFVEGTSATSGCRSFQVDYFLSLSWKGLPYLPVDAVLQASIPRRAGTLDFFVPSPVHEAIISLLTCLIISGWVKDKYFPGIQRTFAADRSAVIAALLPQFGIKSATRLVDLVIDGDRQRVLGCVRSLRNSLALHNLLHSPVHCFTAISAHYAREIAVRYSPRMIETVCIVGPSGSGKSALIASLEPILQSTAKFVQQRRRGPQGHLTKLQRSITASPHSNPEGPRSWLVSMITLLLCLFKEWFDQFMGKKNLTLRLCKGCYRDLPIAPASYRYGGPRWFARWVGKLFPDPDLWIFLNAPVEVVQARNQQLPLAEILSQFEAYSAFAKSGERCVILDASLPAECVKENAYAAIIDALAHRADNALQTRF